MEWDGAGVQGKRVIRQGVVFRAWDTEHVYYYRLRQLRLAACQALQEAQPAQLAEVPLAPKEPATHTSLRLTTRVGTLEIMDADRQTLEVVLRGLRHAE